jgi:hypothetical protein
LQTQLIRIQQNNFRHSTLAQAEQSGSSNCNTYAQQIQVLEAKMSDQECSLYLDTHDMGKDFCSAGL